MRRFLIFLLALSVFVFAACDFSELIEEKTGHELALEMPERFNSLRGYIPGLQGDLPEAVTVTREVELQILSEPGGQPDYPERRQLVFETYRFENTGAEDAQLQLAAPIFTNLRDFGQYKRQIKVDGQELAEQESFFSDPLTRSFDVTEDDPNTHLLNRLNQLLEDPQTLPRAIAPQLIADEPIQVLKFSDFPPAELIEGESPTLLVRLTDIPIDTVSSLYFNGGSFEEGNHFMISNLPPSYDVHPARYLIFYNGVSTEHQTEFYQNGMLEQQLEPIEYHEELIDTTLHRFMLETLPDFFRSNADVPGELSEGRRLLEDDTKLLHLLSPYFNREDFGKIPDWSFQGLYGCAEVDLRIFYQCFELAVPAGATVELELSYDVPHHLNYYGAGKNVREIGFELFRRTLNDVPYHETTIRLKTEDSDFVLLNPLADRDAEQAPGVYEWTANIRGNFGIILEKKEPEN